MTTRLTLLALALFALSCGQLTQFDVPLSSTGVLQGALSSVPRNGFPDYAAGTDASEQIANQGVKPSDIKSATFTSGALVVTNPPTGDLHYLDSFELDISAPGLATKRIAHVAAFPPGQQSYPFVLDAVELKPYVTASSMTITAKLHEATRPTNDEQLEMRLTMHVQL